jgi:hypothetical protein
VMTRKLWFLSTKSVNPSMYDTCFDCRSHLVFYLSCWLTY